MSAATPLRRVHASLILKRSYKSAFAIPVFLWFALSSDLGGSERVPIDALGVAPTSHTLALLGIGVLILLRLGSSAFFAYLHWRRLAYAITPNELVIDKRGLIRKGRAIPFAQVQNIEVDRGLFDRMFGTATVKVEVAGGLADEGTLEALPLAEVAQIHAFAGYPIPEAARLEASSAEPPLLIFSKRRLFLAGLFGWWVAGAALLLPIADKLLDWSSDRDGPTSLIGWVKALASSVGTVQTVALILVLVVVAVAASAAASVIANYRFRVCLQDDALRLMRGLLSTKERLIPLNRVQSASLSSVPLPGSRRWYKLEVKIQDSTKGDSRIVLAPLATIDELRPVLGLLGHPVPSEHGFRRCEPRYRALRLILINWEVLLLSAVPLAILKFAKPEWFGWALCVSALLWAKAWLHEFLRCKNQGYRVENDVLVLRKGGILSRVERISADRIQARILCQSVMERKLGLASVTFDVAGGSETGRAAVCGLNLADARKLSDLLKHAVQASTDRAAVQKAA